MAPKGADTKGRRTFDLRSQGKILLPNREIEESRNESRPSSVAAFNVILRNEYPKT